MKPLQKGIIIVLVLIIVLFIIRLISPTEIDDISPEIFCPELEKYNPDKLWVIPLYKEKPISENKEFCEYLLSLNKSIELHGIYHYPYREFLSENISQEEFEKGLLEFEKCFSKNATMFKPPQLKISEENKVLIENNNLKLKGFFNQITHKVYHCSDTGDFPNWLIRIF